jgi:hypothetical protein
MKYYELYEGESRCTKVELTAWNQSYDIVVVGGGNGGLYCALSAAGEGKKVLLIEKSNWCGGMHVQGLVNGYYYGIRGGLYQETDQRSAALAEKVFYNATDAKRLVIAKLLEEEGIETKTEAVVLGVYTEEEQIVGVCALIDGKPEQVRTQILVDGTSDGHVIRMLPIKTTFGRESDHEVQPFSSVRCVYLDKNEYDGGLRVEAGRVFKRFSVYHEYRDNGYVNQYNEEEYTKAIIRAHGSHVRTLDPAARFLTCAPQIGVREGVLYEGEQRVTLADVLLHENEFDNVLVYCFSDVDKHGSDIAFDETIYQNWFVNCNLSTCTVYIPLPVGSVVPKGWKGLLTTGRCLSTDTYVNSAVRMNVDCFRIGEACGILAATAVDYGQDAMAVPYEELRFKLEERGLFDGNTDKRPSMWTPARGHDRIFIDWLTDMAKIQEVLSTDCPGIGLWSCYLLGKEKVGDVLYGWTRSEDEMLRYNAAIALGLVHDERGLLLLREIIQNRKPFYYMGCRRSNQMRSVIAISLCGQMGDAGIVGELIAILQPQEYEKPMYHQYLEPNYPLSIVKEQNSVYYQHFSNAVAALVKIGLAHPERKDEIAKALHQALDDGSYIRRMTKEPEDTAYYQAAENCRRFVTKNLFMNA